MTRIILGLVFLLHHHPLAQVAESLLNWDGGIAGMTKDVLPAALSLTGFNPADTANFVPYTVNVPRWMGLMEADRFVHVPAGASIQPGDTTDYQFPEGTVFFKRIYLDTIYGDPASRVYLECQIQVRHTDTSWTRINYRYRDDQSDADLAGLGVFLDTTYMVQGLPPSFQYTYTGGVPAVPAAKTLVNYARQPFDCLTCHFNSSANGFITQQLNSGSQMESLSLKGVLGDVPDFTSLQAAGRVVQWADVDDAASSIEHRARSYLAGNCSHCHGGLVERYGGSPLVTNYNYFDKTPLSGQVVPDTALWPGKPDSSTSVTYLVNINMPPPDKVLPDGKAIVLLWNWINAMDGSSANDSPLPAINVPMRIRNIHSVPDMAKEFRVSGKDIYFNENPSIPVKLKVVSLLGRQVALKQITQQHFRLMDEAASGVYFIVDDERSLTFPFFIP